MWAVHRTGHADMHDSWTSPNRGQILRCFAAGHCRVDTAWAGAGVSSDYAGLMVVDSSGRIVLASQDNAALEGHYLTDLAVSGIAAASVKSSPAAVRSSLGHHLKPGPITLSEWRVMRTHCQHWKPK